MEGKFKKGDVVCLKSSPEILMTINDNTIHNFSAIIIKGSFECIWFNINNELQKADIGEDSLTLK